MSDVINKPIEKSPSTLGQAASQSAIDFGFGVGGSVIQSLLGVATSKYNADLQYQYNKKAADDAYNRQVEFWNLQNAYNSPKAQMSRLRQAGLNPALLNGGVQGNTAGGLSSVPNASIGSPSGVSVGSPAATIGATADIMNKLSQADLVNEETKYWMQQAIGVGIENDTRRLLRAQGWTKSSIDEIDRAARWKAAHPNESLPDNPWFDEYPLPDEGINPYVTADTEAWQRIKESISRIDNDTSRLNLEQADFDLERAWKEIRNTYADAKSAQEVNKLIAETFLLWSQKAATDAEQYERIAHGDWYSGENTRARQLHKAELLIKNLEASKILAETDLKQLDAYKQRLRMSGPSWDVKEINDFIGLVVEDILDIF